MKELFRARLLNNKGRERVNTMSKKVFVRQNWNYKVGYDGQGTYNPPSHRAPSSKSLSRERPDYSDGRATATSVTHNRAKFIQVSKLSTEMNAQSVEHMAPRYSLL